MKGRVARKIHKRLEHRMACLVGGCYGYCNKCKQKYKGKKIVNLKADGCKYPNSTRYQEKIKRIANRCYTQYNLCIKVWSQEAWKPDLPYPKLHSLAMIAAKRYGWTERKAVFNMVNLFNEIRFKNRRNKDYK